MQQGCAAFFAEANRKHLEQSAFSWSMEICVRFDTIGNNKSIGFCDISIQINRQIPCCFPNSHCFHCGPNWTSSALFGHAKAMQYGSLTFWCCTSMAAH